MDESLLTFLLTVWGFVNGRIAGGMQDGLEWRPGHLSVYNITLQTTHLIEDFRDLIEDY